MRISKKLLISHLVVSIVPILVIFFIFTILIFFVSNNQITNSLNFTIYDIKSKIEKELNNQNNYSYLIKNAIIKYDYNQSRYIFQSDFDNNIIRYDIKIIEFSYKNNIIKRDFIDVEYANYLIDNEFLNYIWNYMSQPLVPQYFKMSFPQVVSNIVVVRNTSIIFDSKNKEKIGLSIISLPLDSDFLNSIIYYTKDLIIFIETEKNIIFNRSDDNILSLTNKIKNIKFDKNKKYELINIPKLGNFYLNKIPLFIFNNKIICYLGILMGYESINKLSYLYQGFSFIIIIISVIITVTISYFFSKKITDPIENLSKVINNFNFNKIELNENIKYDDEISMLQETFGDMLKKILDYKQKVDSYNDLLTNEVEKKTKELLNQIRSLTLINKLSNFILEIENYDELNFIKKMTEFVSESYKVQYYSLYQIVDKKIKKMFSTKVKEEFKNLKFYKKILNLEKKITNRVYKNNKMFTFETKYVFISCLPFYYKDDIEYVYFFISEKKAAQIIKESQEAVVNLVSMKIYSIRLYISKLETEKLAGIGQFANSIVHDIKNPLTVIKSISEVLSDPDYSDEEKENYKTLLNNEIDMLTNMLNDILDFSRGKLILNKEEVWIDQLVIQLIKFYNSFVRKKNIQINADVHSDSIILIDKNRIWRSIGNIVQNAIDAINENGIITISTEKKTNKVIIKIIDNGPGIPENIQNSLFQPFFTYGKKGGTGLGLATVKKIIEAHNGKIYFESKVHVGTTFFIELPL